MLGADKNFSQRNYLPPELAFQAWLEGGSTTGAVRWLSARGIRNPRNNRVPTRMGVWQRAGEFILKNFDTVRPQVAEVWSIADRTLTDEIWYDFILRIAKYNLSYKRFQEFLIKHPEMRIYYEKQKQTTTRG